MKVKIGSDLVDLKQKDVLGSGGEGTVSRLPDAQHVVKIYHAPDTNRVDAKGKKVSMRDQVALAERRARKIEAFLRHGFGWPSNVLAPLAEARDPSTNQIIGFVMRAAKGGDEIYHLGNRDFRKQQSLTLRDSLKVGVDARRTLDAITKLGVTVGDLNDLGIKFDDQGRTTWLDVDSFQVPGFPCVVAMEAFLDPQLYNKPFDDGKAYFSADSDNYALAVILFKTIFMVHPYAGNHPKLKNLFERALAKVDVFSPGVIYPRWANPPEVVSDELLHAFHEIFVKGGRLPIAADLLQRQLVGLRDCPKCGMAFSATRARCPACDETVIAVPLPGAKPTDTVKVVDDVEFTEWFKTGGEIVYFQALGSHEYAWITFEPTGVELYRWRSGRLLKKVHVHDQKARGFTFGVTRSLLVVGKGEEIAIFATDTDKVRELRRLKTGTFNGRPVFATSVDGVYRMLGIQVFLSKEDDLLKDRLMETQALSAAEDQTWLQVSPNGIIAAMMRFFNETRWFLRSKKGHFPLAVTSAQPGARLVSASLRFDDERGVVLVLRRLIHADGSEHAYLDVLSGLDGTLVRAYEEDLNRSDNLRDIHGRALMGQSVFHPTDRGLVLEIDKTKIKEFPATASFVDARSKVVPHADGVLVIGEKTIGHLRVVGKK